MEDNPLALVPANPMFTVSDVYTVDWQSQSWSPTRFTVKKDSQAVNHGFAAGQSVGSYTVPATDYLGNPRVGATHIGAIEYVAKPQKPQLFVE